MLMEITSDPHGHIIHLRKNKFDSTLNSLGIGIFGIFNSISRVGWRATTFFVITKVVQRLKNRNTQRKNIFRLEFKLEF